MLIANIHFPASLQPPLLTYGSSTTTPITKCPSRKPISKLCTLKRYTHNLHRSLACISAPSSSYLDLDVERKKLKDKLLLNLKASNGSLNDESMNLISSLGDMNPNPDFRLFPHLYTGCFLSLTTSFNSPRQRPQPMVENTYSLGRATFNAFKPIDIEIQFKNTYNHVGIEAKDAYYILIHFVVNGAEDLATPMEGLLINKAVFSVDDPARFDITFKSSTMVPLEPKKDLGSWLKVFGDVNPTMDDKGSATVTLPPAKGFLEYLYLDHELRITRGNRGTVVVVKRVPERVFHV